MKGTIKCESVLSLIPLLFLLGCLFLSVPSVQAQTPQSETQIYNWKNVDEARGILVNHVQQLNQQMPGYTPGTPLHDNAVRRVAYYKAIVQEIDRGETIPKSLENALPAAATLGFTKEASYTSKVVLRALQEEARVLLVN
ncbi:MAG: hypothetical protein OHK0019_25290 [Saprospiraceae bacterium]